MNNENEVLTFKVKKKNGQYIWPKDLFEVEVSLYSDRFVSESTGFENVGEVRVWFGAPFSDGFHRLMGITYRIQESPCGSIRRYIAPNKFAPSQKGKNDEEGVFVRAGFSLMRQLDKAVQRVIKEGKTISRDEFKYGFQDFKVTYDFCDVPKDYNTL